MSPLPVQWSKALSFLQPTCSMKMEISASQPKTGEVCLPSRWASSVYYTLTSWSVEIEGSTLNLSQAFQTTYPHSVSLNSEAILTTAKLHGQGAGGGNQWPHLDLLPSSSFDRLDNINNQFHIANCESCPTRGWVFRNGAIACTGRGSEDVAYQDIF